MNIPLLFTLARLVLGPLFLVVYLFYENMGISLTQLPYVLILLLGASELSDLFDGFLARKRNQVTELGKILDPIADSIFHLTVFLSFTQGVIQLPLFLVLCFFYREFLISTLRTVCALRGVALAARISGKIKAVFQALTALFIITLLIPYSLGMLELAQIQFISLISTVVACLYTFCSGVEYIYANRLYIKKALG